jgi:hypothetical protein
VGEPLKRSVGCLLNLENSMRFLSPVTFLFVVLSAQAVTAQTRSSSGEKQVDALVSASVVTSKPANDGRVKTGQRISRLRLI